MVMCGGRLLYLHNVSLQIIIAVYLLHDNIVSTWNDQLYKQANMCDIVYARRATHTRKLADRVSKEKHPKVQIIPPYVMAKL